MTARTFIELFEPTPVLSLAHVRDDQFIVWDQGCRYYTLTPVSLTVALNFMRALEARGDAVVDEESVERAKWAAAYESTHSVKVPDTPTNVIPLRRDIA